MNVMQTSKRRTYWWLSRRGFGNEAEVFVTRRPAAMEIALDRDFGGDVNAKYCRITYCEALRRNQWADGGWPDEDGDVSAKIAAAEREGDKYIASMIAPDDPDLTDFAELAAEIVALDADLAAAIVDRDQMIRSAAAAGQTHREIGEATGLTAARITQICNNL